MNLDFDPLFGDGWTLASAFDDATGRNGLPPVARLPANVARYLSAAGAVVQRHLFSQHLRPADQTLNATPLLRMRYNDNYVNGRQRINAALFLPPYATGAAPAPGTALATLTAPAGEVFEYMEATTQVEPDDLRVMWFDAEGTVPTAAYLNATVSSDDNFRLTAYAMDQRARLAVGQVDTAWGAAVDLGRFRLGGTVIDGTLEDLRLVEERLWRQFRHVWAAWSSVQEVAGQSRSVTGTAWTNLISLTTADAAWTENRPGEIVSAENAALGPQTSLGHRCAVYAAAATGDGEIRFESSLGSVTITYPNGIGSNWAQAAALLPVRTTQEYDNVVISARNLDPVGITRVWRWMVQPEP